MNLEKVIVTDSVPQTQAFQALPFLTVQLLADPLARAINRIHYSRPVVGMLAGPLVQEED